MWSPQTWSYRARRTEGTYCNLGPKAVAFWRPRVEPRAAFTLNRHDFSIQSFHDSFYHTQKDIWNAYFLKMLQSLSTIHGISVEPRPGKHSMTLSLQSVVLMSPRFGKRSGDQNRPHCMITKHGHIGMSFWKKGHDSFSTHIFPQRISSCEDKAN